MPGTWVLPGCAFEKTMEPFTVDGSLWFLLFPSRPEGSPRHVLFYHKTGVDVHELRILAGLRASAHLSVGSSIGGAERRRRPLGLTSARARGADQARHRNSRKAASSKRSPLPCTPSGAALYSMEGMRDGKTVSDGPSAFPTRLGSSARPPLHRRRSPHRIDRPGDAVATMASTPGSRTLADTVPTVARRIVHRIRAPRSYFLHGSS